MRTVNKGNLWFPILDNLFLASPEFTRHNYETFSNPAVNIIENLTSFVVELAAPGLAKEDFTIEVEEGTLKIASKKADPTVETERDSQYKRREFNYKSFERSFVLPDDINTENIQANYDNGVLRVTLPKMEEQKALKKMVEIS